MEDKKRLILLDIIHQNQTGYVKDRFIGETIQSIYDIRDLKHRQGNGTTTTGGSKIFPREGSAHVRCCQNVV